MVTVLKPVSSGIVADHWVVPWAVPDWPVLVVQVTLATPTLSEAVPENWIEDAEVDDVLPPGDVMVRVGGVVSLPAGGDGGAGDGGAGAGGAGLGGAGAGGAGLGGGGAGLAGGAGALASWAA